MGNTYCFLFVMCFFLLPFMQEGIIIFNEIVAFGYAAGTTVLAWYAYRKHYAKLKYESHNWITLLFIPLTLSYLILFEVSFNTYRFFEPNFLEQHLRHHMFQHTFVFIFIFSAMWMAFQRIPVSEKTMLFSYVLESSSKPSLYVQVLVELYLVFFESGSST